jgi:hypothetical protein
MKPTNRQKCFFSNFLVIDFPYNVKTKRADIYIFLNDFILFKFDNKTSLKLKSPNFCEESRLKFDSFFTYFCPIVLLQSSLNCL